MLVRSLSCLSVALLIAGSAQAADGLPSQSLLSDMGLAGISVMNDADAMAIRGFGYKPKYDDHHYSNKPSATAYGSSYASVSGYGAHASSQDGFESHGKYHAGGKHGSRAYIKVTKRGGGGNGGGNGNWKPKPKPQVKKVEVFAGGYAYASSH